MVGLFCILAYFSIFVYYCKDAGTYDTIGIFFHNMSTYLKYDIPNFSFDLLVCHILFVGLFSYVLLKQIMEGKLYYSMVNHRYGLKESMKNYIVNSIKYLVKNLICTFIGVLVVLIIAKGFDFVGYLHLLMYLFKMILLFLIFNSIFYLFYILDKHNLVYGIYSISIILFVILDDLYNTCIMSMCSSLLIETIYALIYVIVLFSTLKYVENDLKKRSDIF